MDLPIARHCGRDGLEPETHGGVPVAMRRGVGLVLAIVIFSCLASLTGLVAIY
jgi:hypothetical protein